MNRFIRLLAAGALVAAGMVGCDSLTNADADAGAGGAGGGAAGAGGAAGGAGEGGAGGAGGEGGQAGAGGEGGQAGHGGEGGHAAPHWSYEDDESGPAHWGELSPEWTACAEGLERSPVDVPAVAPANHPPLEIDYQDTPLTIENNGHTVEVHYAEGSSLTVEGETWNLVQFHFHAQSEHTLASERFPLEVHLVHQNDAGELAVIAVLFSSGGADHAGLATVFDHLPADEGEPAEVEGVTVNAGDLLPAGHAAWRYDGSLTTPPCSEGVRWFMMSEPVAASAEQISAFSTLYDTNFRPVQSLNERHIESPNWGYEGHGGPDHWAELSSDWAACGEGMAQSPIDLPAFGGGVPSVLAPDYQTALPQNLVDNGHTVQVNVDGGDLGLLNDHWALKQFHFHAHSEHTVQGVSNPIEIHFVHQNDAGDLAVLGAFITEGEVENATLAAILSALPPANDDTPVDLAEDAFDVHALLPAAVVEDLAGGGFPAYQGYRGSLTTPPCTEGVQWFLLQEPVEATADQIAAFTARYDANFRPVQPTNGRQIGSAD